MRFVKESFIDSPPERIFAFHQLPDAIDRLIPPWENSKIVLRADISIIGSRAIVETRIFGLIPVEWVAEHTAYDPPYSFEDVQISGPFKSWRHRHIIEPQGEGSTLRDEIEYEPPMWFLGRLTAPFAIEPKLVAMFDYRHAVTAEWCRAQ